MGKIKKILENELVGGTQSTDVYPVTSTKAVYDENNERLDNILGASQAKLSELEKELTDLSVDIHGGTIATELPFTTIEGKYVNNSGGLSPSQGKNAYQYNIAEYAGKKIRLTVSASISNQYYSLYSIQDSYTNILKHGSTLNEITVPYTEIIDLSTLTSPYKLLLNDDSITTITVEVLTEVKGAVQPLFDGKKIVFFGDSITALKDSANKGYIDYLHELLGGTMYNAGIGGAGFLNRTPCYYIKVNSKATIDGTITVKFGNMNEKSFNVSSSDSVADIVTLLSNTIKTGYYFITNIIDDTVEIRPYRPNYFDVSDIVINTGSTGASITVVNTYTMCKNFINTSDAANNLEIPNMINGLATGDWTYQRLASEYLGGDNTAKIDQLASLSINDVDLVVIFGGTNDYNLTTSDWGTPDEKANTTSWQITRSIAALLQAKPSLKIVTFTPIVRYFGNNMASWDDSLWGDNYEVNSHVGVMKSLVDVISTCYKYWHIPCYDLYYSLGWNKYNYKEFFNNNDGTHPYKGFKQLAEKMYEYLNNIVI